MVTGDGESYICGGDEYSGRGDGERWVWRRVWQRVYDGVEIMALRRPSRGRGSAPH